MIYSDFLYLSSNGDSFTLYSNSSKIPLSNEHKLLLQTALTCKSHQAVLEFLEKFKVKKEEEWGISLNHFTHLHYPKHRPQSDFGVFKSNSHTCSVEEMEEFIQLRMKDKSSPHLYFDKIEKSIDRTIKHLSHQATRPITGFSSSLLMVSIGSLQTTTSLALMILFGLPAHCFKSHQSQIIVERSVTNLGSGLFHMTLGALQANPVMSKWIHFKIYK